MLVGNDEDEEETLNDEEQEKRTRGIVSNETAAILSGLGSGPLDVRIKRLAEERDDLQVGFGGGSYFTARIIVWSTAVHVDCLV